MDCTKCGFSNPDAARFCAGCGHTIGQIECQKCSSVNPAGSRFCTSCGNSLADETTSTKPDERSHAERRLLTVMFCDLVDSTTIVDSLDPEETRSIIRGFQSHARAIIEKSGGRITEYLGDGIVAQFTRHETNAERAINAGLELINKLNDEKIIIGKTGKSVEVRCGIATGLAVVGDMLGDARIRSESAIGLPLNLAARIQGLANPSEIVIAGDTFRLTRGLFEFEDIGRHNLKGIKDSQQVWRVVKEKNVSSRFMAHAAEMTPMVDREDAMGVLLNCWESSKRGQADAVIFTGEAGIGKSRILQELGKKISVDDFYYLEYQCAPYHTNTALYPVINRLEATAAFEHNDKNAERLVKLEDLLRRSSGNFEKEMPAFVSLLGLQTEDKWALPNLDPDEKKELIFTTLIDNMFSLAKVKPVLIKIEDVHWVDPTTLELLGRMVKALVGQNILLLITSRPGFEADFTEESHVTRLEIDRLPQQYTAQLIEGVQGANSLPKEVIDEIIKRTEGVPLFTEELSKSLMESIQAGGVLAESNLLARKDIPTTLHDSLLSRLDRLPKASRTIAQLAAVIGRDFSFDLLEQIADYKDKNLYQDLAPLLQSQLVYQEKAPPYAEFSFKHALVRDVAYENLLQSERVDIHKNIAEAIELNYPEIIKNTPELVARHFTEGKQYEKAIKYWLEAGKKASQQFALLEAREHLNVGLKLLRELTDNEQLKTTKLEYLITLGPVLMSLQGSGSKETVKNYADAVELCDQLPDSELQFKALWGQWNASMDYKGDHAFIWANRIQDLAQRLDYSGLKLQAQHCQWTTYFHHGDFFHAHEHIVKGLELYEFEQHYEHASIYGGHDPKVCGTGFLSHSLWFLGKETQAIEQANNCYNWATKIRHKGSIFHAIELNMLFHLFRREQAEISNWAKKFYDICAELQFPEYEGRIQYCQGLVMTYEGLTDQGIKSMKQGMSKLFDIGTTEDFLILAEIIAETLEKIKKHEEALDYLAEIEEVLDSQSIQYWKAEVFRRKGSLLAKIGEYDKALQAFKFALETAKEQKAKPLELRAAISLYEFNTDTELYGDAKDTLMSILRTSEIDNTSLEVIRAKSILVNK